MGYGIGGIYSVPLNELRSLPGTPDLRRAKKLARMVSRDFIGSEQIDEMGEEYDPPNTLYQAVQHLLSGKPLEDRGPLYGYAVEALCWAIGSTFHMPIGFPPYERLDEYLLAHGSPVTLRGLLFDKHLLVIPEPSCFPNAGVREPEQVVAASEFLATLPEPADEYLAIGVAEMRSRVEEAIKHETDGLIEVYY